MPASRTAPPEGDARVLGPPVGVMDEACARATPCDGHVEGVEDELGAQVAGHRPADDPAAEGVDDDRDVEEALPRSGT